MPPSPCALSAGVLQSNAALETQMRGKIVQSRKQVGGIETIVSKDWC
jgi:hypothetical protein